MNNLPVGQEDIDDIIDDEDDDSTDLEERMERARMLADPDEYNEWDE